MDGKDYGRKHGKLIVGSLYNEGRDYIEFPTYDSLELLYRPRSSSASGYTYLYTAPLTHV
jgi:hypothetical protein